MIRMAALWGEILGIEDIGAEDRFFDLGGHSLMAVEMISRVEREFRVSVPLATIFSYPSLEEFTRRVTAGTGKPESDRLVPIKADRRSTSALLSSCDRRERPRISQTDAAPRF